MHKLFSNKTVVISGGLGDIGRAIAKEFASGGANIALCDMREKEEAHAFLEELRREYPVECHYAQVDVSNDDAVEEWLDEIEIKWGVATIIIANAATVTLAGILEMTSQQWNRELRVNLDGAFYLTQLAARKLVEKKLPGHIVFVGSWAAHAVHANLPAYCVAKAGMRMLCKCLALELAPHQVLVNEIAPGYVDAGLSGKIWEHQPDLVREATEKVPIKKIMSSASVAWEVAHLCHPNNEHITGSTLLMDGGLSLRS